MQGYRVKIMKASKLQRAIVRRLDSKSLGPAGEPSGWGKRGLLRELSREEWRL